MHEYPASTFLAITRSIPHRTIGPSTQRPERTYALCCSITMNAPIPCMPTCCNAALGVSRFPVPWRSHKPNTSPSNAHGSPVSHNSGTAQRVPMLNVCPTWPPRPCHTHKSRMTQVVVMH